MSAFNRDRKPGGSGNFGKRSFGGGGGRSQMHKAVCSNCGQECEVPFRPTGDRPVFCNNCFKKQGGGVPARAGGGFGHGKPGFGDKRMFEATCAKCGNKCEVPFRPAEGKPVYCSQCFDKGGNIGAKSSDQFKQQFDMLNAKLDRILKALNPAAAEKTIPEVKEVKKVKEALAKTKTVSKKAKAKKKK